MKIVLSRKGFDSSIRGFASPIMPSGRLLSLPIPVSTKRMVSGELGIPYADLRFDGQPISNIIDQVYNHDQQFPYDGAHLDLDLDRDRCPNRHEDWLRYHPHVVNAGVGKYKRNNTIYIARETLQLNGCGSIAGGGVFPHFKPALRLTDPNEIRRSYWRLPKWFYPFYPVAQSGRPPLSYHRNRKRWTLYNDHVILQTTARGQEFVFDTEDYPKAIEWLKELFENCC